MRRLVWLWPYPQELTVHDCSFPRPRALRCAGGELTERQRDELTIPTGLEWSPREAEAYPFDVRIDPHNREHESFELEIGEHGARLVAGGEAGVTYGLQCFAQVALLSDEGRWPALSIRDSPTYRRRSVMVDLGRSVSNLAMLKRLVRIYSRLRFNELHLRLYDDELCGVRFDGLPMGHDNPHALTLAELARYAAAHHVAVVPELESWATSARSFIIGRSSAAARASSAAHPSSSANRPSR